ncbi:MAG TPA: hypothetical protein P5120_02600 [Spirochaetota bacterium]|nr:hypothetical protein [Spirochaetota bacterium]
MKRRALFMFLTAAVFIAICFIPYRGETDTLILKNGTLLVGKVKSSGEKSIVFKNYYGAFTVNRAEIEKLYITKTYKEDISLRKKMGMDFSVEDIKKNYEAGEKKLTVQEVARLKTEEKESAENRIRSGGSIYFEGGWFYSIGEVNDTIPYGYGGYAAYEQGLDFITGGRYLLMPGFRIECGYLYYSRGDASMKGPTGSLGPVWLIPVPGGNLRFSMQPGASGLNVENGDLSASTFTFTFHSILGYEYLFSSASIFINARYLYVYDKDVFFSSAGITAGFSYKLW